MNFNNLTYSNKAAIPIGRPIDDLHALYKKKDDDYNIVLDRMTTMEQALDNIPYHEKDSGIVDKARDITKKTFDEYNQREDLENRLLDSKRFANDLAIKYGLSAVQKVAKQKQSYIDRLHERFEEGKISKSHMTRAIADAEERYGGLEYDDNTGRYLGSYSGRDVLDKINFSEKVADVVKGFESDKIALFNDNGEKLVKTGKGYYNSVTHEYVNREEVIAAAKSYLYNDPDFVDRVNDDLYYETKDMLRDPVTGERRSMTLDDLKNLSNTRVSAAIMQKYNLKDINNLPKILEEKNMSIEDVYYEIRKEQMANSAIQLGVDKESFDKYSDKYTKNWLLAEQMTNSGTPVESFAPSDFGILDTYYTSDNLTTEDTKNIAKINSVANENLVLLQSKLNKLESEYRKNPNNVNSNDIKTTKKEIEKAKRLIEISSQRISKVLNENMSEEMDEIIKNSFDMNANFEERGVYNYANRYPDKLGIKGLSINKGSLERLVSANINESLTNEVLQEYIQLDKNAVLAEGYLQNSSFALDQNKVQENYKAILENGLEAIPNESNTLKDKVQDYYAQELNTSTNLLRNKINNITNNINDKIEKNEVSYTKDFKKFILPDLEPSEARSNPIYQLDYMLKKLPKENVSFYTGLGSAISGLDVKTTIENTYDVEDEEGEIVWDKATLSPSLDSMADINTGDYNPVVLLQVPIITDKEKNLTKTVQIPVNYNEPTYAAKYKEALFTYRNSLANKENLTTSEKLMLDRIDTTMYNMSEYGRNLDLLDLYNLENGDTVEFEAWEDTEPMQIKAFKYGSAQNMSFYLTKGKGENEKYWAIDNSNNEEVLVDEEDLYSNRYTALGGNSPLALKTLIAGYIADDVFNEEENKDTYRIDETTLVDVSDKFGGLGINVDARVAPEIVEHIDVLTEMYGDLVLTEGVRPDGATYGAEDSEHKYAKAIDLRINEQSVDLTKKSEAFLNRLGIKSAAIHNEGTAPHVHIEFL